MTYKFYLRSPDAGEKRTRILLVVTHGGKTYQKSTGISVRAKDFKKQRVKDETINGRLRIIENVLNEHLNQFSRPKDIETAMEAALAASRGEDESTFYDPGRPFLWDYFEQWSLRGSERAKDRNLAFRRITAMMGRNTDWEDIDGDWYFRFNEKCNEHNYSHNYKSTMTAKLKTVMNEGFNRGFHKNEAFRKFNTSYIPSDTIALTQEEVDTLWNAPLEGRAAHARDVFMVGIYCAGRFQDYSKISSENVNDGMLRYVQRKTGTTIVIPCAPQIVAVLERYGGVLPRITEQEVGRYIKSICRDLGGSFLNTVEVSKIRADRKSVEKHQRWELVSTHTARRTGATLLYKSGVPIALCRLCTGHTTDQMFMRYLKIGKEEGAQLLAKSEFFNRKIEK